MRTQPRLSRFRFYTGPAVTQTWWKADFKTHTHKQKRKRACAVAEPFALLSHPANPHSISN